MTRARTRQLRRPTRSRLRIPQTAITPRLQKLRVRRLRRRHLRMTRRRPRLLRHADPRREIPKRRNLIRVAVPRLIPTHARIVRTLLLHRRRQKARKNPLASRNRFLLRDHGARLRRIDRPRRFPRTMRRNRQTYRAHRTRQRNRAPHRLFRRCGLRRPLLRQPKTPARAALLTRRRLRIRTAL
jgi:hypothetical protein